MGESMRKEGFSLLGLSLLIIAVAHLHLQEDGWPRLSGWYPYRWSLAEREGSVNQEVSILA